MIRVWLTLGTL